MSVTSKVAIYDNDDVLRFLNVANTRKDQVRCFLMVAFGMHPENLRRLKADDALQKGLLLFKRAKNQKPRREMLPTEQANVVYDIVGAGQLRISNRAYELICEYMGAIAVPNYPLPPVSPVTLRKTAILNMIRRYRGPGGGIDYVRVSKQAGCSIDVVAQNYLDLDQWEAVAKKQEPPLDLTDFVFMD